MVKSNLWKKIVKVEGEVPDLSPVLDQASEIPTSITLVKYNKEEVQEYADISLNECKQHLDPSMYTWIHIQGQPKPSFLREIADLLKLHPLGIDDLLNIGERSKTEFYDDQVVVLLGMPSRKDHKIINHQVSLFFVDKYLVSFHNGENDPFRAIRRRLQHPKAILRNRGIDYLLYMLADVVIDHGFPVLDEFAEEVEQAEDELLSIDSRDTVKNLYTIKRELLILRLKLRPQREALRVLIRSNSHLFTKETKVYLRDVYDHSIRLVDTLDTYNDLMTNMLDAYLSMINDKTFISNEVQRKATVMATLFAPLTFITGIYGMNFMNMPETQWEYGFFGSLIFMGVMGIGLWFFFRRKKWL